MQFWRVSKRRISAPLRLGPNHRENTQPLLIEKRWFRCIGSICKRSDNVGFDCSSSRQGRQIIDSEKVSLDRFKTRLRSHAIRAIAEEKHLIEIPDVRVIIRAGFVPDAEQALSRNLQPGFFLNFLFDIPRGG